MKQLMPSIIIFLCLSAFIQFSHALEAEGPGRTEGEGQYDRLILRDAKIKAGLSLNKPLSVSNVPQE